MSSKKGGGARQIVGYRYFMAVHMGIGRGPIDELCEIRVGDLVAWTGSIIASAFSSIAKPNLFGGDDKEGGISGTFKLFMGEPTQTIDSVIANQIPNPVPGWRGVASLFYYGQISSNNPYPKPWKMRVRRTTAGWDNDIPWYTEKAKIILSNDPLAVITINAQPSNGDFVYINGVPCYFHTSYQPPDPVVIIGADTTETASNLSEIINDNSVLLGDVSATSSGSVVEIRGLTTPVVSSPFAWAVIQSSGGTIHAMNPAHIIYECATNNVWGRGLPASMMDDEGFRTAADTLYSEGFGLCLRWNRQEDIDKFVLTVVSHIGAAVYIDRSTGLLTMKLIRNDYDPDLLNAHTFENGIIDIVEDQSSSNDTIFNEVIAKFNDPITDQIGQVRVQNLASFQSLGTLISTTVEYLGCATASLALRLAQRDLQINSSNLRRLTVKMDRSGWDLKPGGVFKISVPTRGIDSMILRIGNIEDSPITDGTMTISAIQDVFTLPETSFVTPQPSFWTPTDRSPRIIEDRLLTELTYRDLAENSPAGELSAMEDDTGLIKIFARQPSGACIDYIINDRTDGETDYVNRGIAGFDTGAILSADIDYYDTSATFEDGFNLSDIFVPSGFLMLIDDEYIRCDLVDVETGEITIARGCIDTIPAQHSAGSIIWFQVSIPSSDFREYSTGELIHVRLLSRTTTDTLDPDLANIDDITIEGRQGRPYPPGDMKVGGVPVLGAFLEEDSDIVLTWAHRDRIVQGDFIFEHEAASTGPETGTTYNVRVYDGSDPTPTTLLRETTGITTAGWTYTTAMAVTDGDLPSFWFEVEAERENLISWQIYLFRVIRSPGYDEGFDYNFDGGV